MYGAITGLYFQGGMGDVLDAIRERGIMPRKPAREPLCDVCPKSQMPTVSFPALEARLAEGYRGGRDGGVEIPESLMPVRFEGKDSHNYGFSGEHEKGERLYWLA